MTLPSTSTVVLARDISSQHAFSLVFAHKDSCRARTPSSSRTSSSPRTSIISQPAITNVNGMKSGHERKSSGSRRPKKGLGKAATADGHARRSANHSRHSSRSPKDGDQAPWGNGLLKKIIVDWEIPRKVLHSSIGFLTIYLYISNGSSTDVVIILSYILGIIVPLDILRLYHPTFEQLYEKCVGFLMRESEKKKSNGVIWYIIGVTFSLLFYPLDIAVFSILVLSWADTAASTFGRMFGHLTPRLPRRLPFVHLPFAPRKSVAGFLAASVTGACIAVGFWRWLAPLHNTEPTWSWGTGVSPSFSEGLQPIKVILRILGIQPVKAAGWAGLGSIGLVAGLVSGVAEALDLGSLDDNLTLPIISGGCLLGFFKILSLFA